MLGLRQVAVASARRSSRVLWASQQRLVVPNTSVRSYALPVGPSPITHNGGLTVVVPNNTGTIVNVPSLAGRFLGALEEAAIWMASTLKRRNRKMNKHKLRKRRKKNRKKVRKM